MKQLNKEQVVLVSGGTKTSVPFHGIPFPLPIPHPADGGPLPPEYPGKTTGRDYDFSRSLNSAK